MLSIASSCLCQDGHPGILQWMHIRLHVNRGHLLALGGWAAVGRMQLHPELRKGTRCGCGGSYHPLFLI